MSSWKERNRGIFDEAENFRTYINNLISCYPSGLWDVTSYKHVTPLFASSKSSKVRTIFHMLIWNLNNFIPY